MNIPLLPQFHWSGGQYDTKLVYLNYLFYFFIGISKMKKLLLVDVDCGVDDAQAIMMALASPNVEVLGITCCYGNSILENICKNVLRVLHICNKLEVICSCWIIFQTNFALSCHDVVFINETQISWSYAYCTCFQVVSIFTHNGNHWEHLLEPTGFNQKPHVEFSWSHGVEYSSTRDSVNINC